MKNKLATITLAPLIALIAVTGLCGCTREKVYRIGVSQCSEDDWRSKMNDEINRELMFHEDAVAEIRSADDDNATQIADIRYFADNGFDIIIVSPNEAAAITPVIKEVYDRGIPVIIFDRNIIGDSYTARIGADDEGLGRSAARYALHLEGSGAKAVEIYGLAGSTPAEGRHRGFAEEFTDNGGELAEVIQGNWNKEDAMPALDSILRSRNDIDLIYAHNDRMAIGASEVASRLGRRDIKIIGIDAAPEIGIRAVADSVIDATFLYPTEGHRLIRTALAILKGEPYERETILPVSSAVDLSNADVLLLQNETLKEETAKMKLLKSQVDDYWARHSSQTSLFYASVAIILLLFGVVFLVLRAYWQRKRHQRILLMQNKTLEEQRDMQQQLNEQLRDAINSKLMFFTNVSHDLRTPLTLIAEPVAQLADAPNLTPAQHSLIKIADKNVRILRRLINQILDFRKYENGKLTLRLSEINLVQAAGEWTESFEGLARKRHIKLTLTVSGDFPATTIAVDAEKMERVFFNLVSNALKYTPDGGRIAVTCGMTSPDRFVIRVADTGEGISERDLGNIFDRFYQVERVHPNGSGIGLSLCKAFVEMHGGTIGVESIPGKGSVFTVELPVRHTDDATDTAASVPEFMTREDVEAELETEEEEPSFDEGKPLLLVIDDNRDIRSMISTLLAPDYNIIGAGDGREGIRKAVKHVPDLIICDVMMPVMDGLECCRRLKAEVSTSHIPVLMLTACTMDEQRVQGYDSGADGYLSKPFSGAVLMSRCASLIANRKRIKELWQRGDFPTASPSSPATQPGNQPSGDIDNEFYTRFLNVFTGEMANPELSVDTLASRMGLERTQFYRKIKALTNFSPVELIRNLRLKQARHLIKTTDRTMSEIAYDVGFSTPAYFTRCYREAYGETPTETRNNLRN